MQIRPDLRWLEVTAEYYYILLSSYEFVIKKNREP